MSWQECPEALYGRHGEANTVGKCPYCGVFLGRRRPRVARRTPDWELVSLRNHGTDPVDFIGDD